MLKKINISTRIAMVFVVVLSILNVVLNLNLFAVPAPLFAIFNFSLVILLTFLPELLKRFNMEISNGLYYLLLFTVLISFVGGMGFKLYQIINHYDTVIHFFNGGVIAVVGFAFIRAQFDDWREHIILITIGAILISISVGAIWEIYEFVADLLLDGNMQRYNDIFHSSGTVVPFIGQAALFDTMTDIIVDTLGGILGAFILYRSAIRKGKLSNWFRLSHID